MSRVGSGNALTTTTSSQFDEAVAPVSVGLAAQGFGVLCEIDVQATLNQKLGAEREPYLILGACNPRLAHAALEADPELDVLLPCNVVVYAEAGVTHVEAVDAEPMLSIVGNDELAEVGQANAQYGRHGWRTSCGGAGSSFSPRRMRTLKSAALIDNEKLNMVRKRPLRLTAQPIVGLARTCHEGIVERRRLA
jgi:uncharacterized protein (DUF302 family)